MKYQIFIICCLFILTSLSCNRKNVKTKYFTHSEKLPDSVEERSGEFLNSFGKVRIGMSTKDFNMCFKETVKDTMFMLYKNDKGNYAKRFKELSIDKNIKLQKVVVQFKKDKLCRIASDYNKDLFEQLQKTYGGDIKSQNWIFFPTDSINIECRYSLTGIELTTWTEWCGTGKNKNTTANSGL